MGFEVAASLAVASLDLQLVKSLRGAIRAADAASGRQFPAAAIGPAPNPQIVAVRVLHPVVEREPVSTIEPRRVFHPMPHYAPREVIHLEPRRETRECGCPESITPEVPISNPSPILPPWRQMPWDEAGAPIDCGIARFPRRPKIKHVARHVDIGGKGMVIDLFI